MGNAVLSLDPSSKAIGWAIMPWSGDLKPLGSGVITRPKKWPWRLRLESMVRDVRDLMVDCRGLYRRIVVEVPGKGQAGRLKYTHGAGAPMYGAAVGAVLSCAWALDPPAVTVGIESSHWTKTRGSVKSKDSRIRELALVSGYDPKKDPGGDEADAIMLGSWYVRHHGLEEGTGCLLHLPPVPVNAGSARKLSVGNVTTRSDGALVAACSTWKP